jgi:hypothetical protein
MQRRASTRTRAPRETDREHDGPHDGCCLGTARCALHVDGRLGTEGRCHPAALTVDAGEDHYDLPDEEGLANRCTTRALGGKRGDRIARAVRDGPRKGPSVLRFEVFGPANAPGDGVWAATPDPRLAIRGSRAAWPPTAGNAEDEALGPHLQPGGIDARHIPDTAGRACHRNRRCTRPTAPNDKAQSDGSHRSSTHTASGAKPAA